MDEPEHVVYVDSDASSEVESALSDVGLDVESTATIEECLERLSGATCLITEYELPDGNGVELCERVRGRCPELPIVVFTDGGSEAVAGEAVAGGADGYVPKSQGVETLTTRVIELLYGETDADPSDRLELLIEQSPLAIIEWNLEFEVVGWNPAATRLFGYTFEEIRGEAGVELLVPEDTRDDVRQGWDTLVERGENRRGVNRNVRKDGSSITCEWFNTPIVDDRGEVVSVLSFAQDVTNELKRADALEALQETTHELMRAGSRDDIAEIVIEAAADVIERPRAGLRYWDDDAERLEIVATTDELVENSPEITPVRPGEGVIWEAYESGEPLVIEDASTDMVPYDLDTSVGSAVVHPIGDHGTLTVASPASTGLGPAEVHLVHVLAVTAEAALDRAERERELERAKTLIEAVGDSIYAIDTEGYFETVNDTLAQVTGYDRDELIGEHVSLVLSDESVERGREDVRDLLSAPDDYVATYEVTVENREGEEIPCEVNTTLLRTDGEFDGSVGIVRDISDRKQMERELVDRKAKIESLHGIASRLEGCESEREIYELTVEAAEGVLNFDVCLVDSVQDEHLVMEAVSTELPADGYTERTTIDDGIAGKTYRNDRTYRIGDLHADDDATPETDAYRSVLSVPIGDAGVFQAVSTEPDAFDADDEELAELLLSHVADALDRLAFEEKLREERDRFAALFENVPDAVVSTRMADGDPVVERANPAFERVFGYEEAELVDRPLDRFIVPVDRQSEAAAINDRGRQGEIVETEVKRRTTDGLRDFMMRLVPMNVDQETERAFGVYTDITEQKQRQKRVEILNRVLRHDLRNGMNIINGCAEMLADIVGDTDSQYAEIIQERASELIGLAEKTRAVERTLDRGDAATGPVDVVDGVESAIDRVESDFPEAEIDRSVPDRAFARADDLLQTAIFHVVENAVEHNDRDRPSVEIELDEVGPDDEALVLTVADDGPGIPDEEQELLQDEKEITQLRHASGLGLWLVNWVVTQSGGQLTFEENEPRGTLVKIRVPKAEVPTAQAVTDGAAAGG